MSKLRMLVSGAEDIYLIWLSRSENIFQINSFFQVMRFHKHLSDDDNGQPIVILSTLHLFCAIGYKQNFKQTLPSPNIFSLLCLFSHLEILGSPGHLITHSFFSKIDKKGQHKHPSRKPNYPKEHHQWLLQIG